MKSRASGVYVFHGTGARFAAAVYEAFAEAAADIENHKLSGMLTWYPVGRTVYDHAVEEGLFTPKRVADGKFVQSFTSAMLDHHHFEDGQINCP